MMGFSTAQRPDFRDMQAVSMSPADAALTDNVAQLRRIAASIRLRVRGIEHDLTEHRRTTRDLPAIVARSTDEEIDLAVDQFLRQEQALREAWEQTMQLCRRLEAKARHFRPATYPLVRQITGAAESWYRPYLRFLRDVRWEIMALQADRAPESDGPVLASASDVDACFRSLPPAA
jgi:hypothetical protein